MYILFASLKLNLNEQEARETLTQPEPLSDRAHGP